MYGVRMGLVGFTQKRFEVRDGRGSGASAGGQNGRASGAKYGWRHDFGRRLDGARRGG